MNSLRLAVSLFLVVCLLPFTLHGQMKRPSGKLTGPVDITARELLYNKEQNIYTARGDVELKEGTRRLNADFVLYNDVTKDAFAEGHVVFQDQFDTVNAERMSLNMTTQKGTIENGRVFTKAGNFYMNGKEIEKIGESSYLIHSGIFTTCGWEGPFWTFSAKEVELTMGEYATARSTTFSILGHRVAYLPWSIFPVKTERQSGFLLPQFQLSSRDGTIFRSAYYWAIAKDKDATFFLDWIQQRGIKPGVEYRYYLDQNTKGAWYASFIDDAKYGHDRYQIKGEHQQVFGDMTFTTSINHVSDYLYLQDLGRTTLERSESSLRSVAFIEKPLPRSLLTVEGAYFQDLTQKSNDNTIQYLPSGSYFTEYLPLLKNRVYGDVTSDLTNFVRSQGERFTRFTATPSLRVPYAWNGLNFLGSGSLVEKAYRTDPASPGENDMIHHEAIALQGDANAQFLKDSSTDLFKIGNVQSIIMPRLQYNYYQNTKSLSGIPSIDLMDRLSNMNNVTYSFNHYLNAVKDGNVREISLLEISQTYGLTQKLGDNPFLYQGSGDRLSQVHTRLTLYPMPQTFWYVHDDYFDVSGKGLQNMVNSIHYARLPMFQMDLSHSYAPGLTTGTSVNQVWIATLTRLKVFDLVYQVRYDLLEHTWLNTLYSVTYHPTCWGLTFTVIQSRVPKDTSFHFSFNLQGITQKIGAY